MEDIITEKTNETANVKMELVSNENQNIGTLEGMKYEMQSEMKGYIVKQ